MKNLKWLVLIVIIVVIVTLATTLPVFSITNAHGLKATFNDDDMTIVETVCEIIDRAANPQPALGATNATRLEPDPVGWDNYSDDYTGR